MIKDLDNFHTSRNIDLCGNTCSMLPLASTLPLSKEGILHHTKSVSKEHKLPFLQGLGQNIYNLLICGNILNIHCSLLDPIPDEVVSYLNMLGPIMKYYILRYFDTTLVIAVDHCRLKLLIK